MTESERREGARLLFDLLLILEKAAAGAERDNTELKEGARELSELLDIRQPFASMNDDEKESTLVKLRDLGIDFCELTKALSEAMGPDIEKDAENYLRQKAEIADLHRKLAELDQAAAQLRDLREKIQERGEV